MREGKSKRFYYFLSFFIDESSSLLNYIYK
jgi:hypothetical protein